MGDVNVDFLDYVIADDHLATSEELTDDEIVAQVLQKDGEGADEGDANGGLEDEEEEPELDPLTLSEGIAALENVRRFLSQLPSLPDETFGILDKVENLAVSKSIALRKQSKINDFFKVVIV